MSGFFKAKYPATCGDCERRIEPGDWVVFNQDRVLICKDCADANDEGEDGE